MVFPNENQTAACVAIIGAGQAGLAAAYWLRQIGVKPVLFEAASEVGASWAARYDSLRLFTPAQYSNLPGFDFPAHRDHYPSKDEVSQYLSDYVRLFNFDVRFGHHIDRLEHKDGKFRLICDGSAFWFDNVVIATGALSSPLIPEFTTNLPSGVRQLHSSDYRNLSSIQGRRILIVGAGNSGVQIAEELVAAGLKPVMSVDKLPKQLPQRFLGKDIFWWLIKSGFVKATPKKLIGSNSMTAIPTIGSDLKGMIKKGLVDRRMRAVDGGANGITFADGVIGQFDTVIWATGFARDFSWIAIPEAFLDGEPRQDRGQSPVPGLFFIGLPFMHSKGSAFLSFVTHDAEYLATRVAVRLEEN